MTSPVWRLDRRTRAGPTDGDTSQRPWPVSGRGGDVAGPGRSGVPRLVVRGPPPLALIAAPLARILRIPMLLATADLGQAGRYAAPTRPSTGLEGSMTRGIAWVPRRPPPPTWANGRATPIFDAGSSARASRRPRRASGSPCPDRGCHAHMDPRHLAVSCPRARSSAAEQETLNLSVVGSSPTGLTICFVRKEPSWVVREGSSCGLVPPAAPLCEPSPRPSAWPNVGASPGVTWP